MRQKICGAVVVACGAIAAPTSAQSPTWPERLTPAREADAEAVGPRSAYVGAQVGYDLSGEGGFAENFQATARALLEAFDLSKDSSTSIYLVGNLSRLPTDLDADEREQKLQELLTSAEGLQVSLTPHYVIGDMKKKGVTFWGSAGWRLNAAEAAAAEVGSDEEPQTVFLHQGRFSVGAEAAFLPGRISGLPVSVSIEPMVTVFDDREYARVFGEPRSTLLSLAFTLILPAGAGRALMLERVISNDARPVLRVGVLLTGTVAP